MGVAIAHHHTVKVNGIKMHYVEGVGFHLTGSLSSFLSSLYRTSR